LYIVYFVFKQYTTDAKKIRTAAGRTSTEGGAKKRKGLVVSALAATAVVEGGEIH